LLHSPAFDCLFLLLLLLPADASACCLLSAVQVWDWLNKISPRERT
jgi:hypothetical protein